MNKFNILIGNKIKELRLNKNLSQEEFCNLLDNKISRSNLSKIELGKISTTANLIKIIAEKFKISPYWLLEIKENEIKKEELEIINKYKELAERDRIRVETYIDFIMMEKREQLLTSMNIDKEENEKSS